MLSREVYLPAPDGDVGRWLGGIGYLDAAGAREENSMTCCASIRASAT